MAETYSAIGDSHHTTDIDPGEIDGAINDLLIREKDTLDSIAMPSLILLANVSAICMSVFGMDVPVLPLVVVCAVMISFIARRLSQLSAIKFDISALASLQDR
jgi:hypothetical protein